MELVDPTEVGGPALPLHGPRSLTFHTSAPHVALTTRLTRKFGVDVKVEGDMDGGTPSFCITADTNCASPGSILVKGDAISASYFLAGAVITGGMMTCTNVSPPASRTTSPSQTCWRAWAPR